MEELEKFDFGTFVNLIGEKLSGWLETGVSMLPNMLIAVLIVVLFAFLARVASRLFKKVSGNFISNTSLQRLFTKMIKATIVIAGIFIALSVLQLNKAVTSFLAGAGIIGLALGFAFQDTAANFMAGILMSVRRPFKIGDIISAHDIMGTVQKIDFRTTSILTFQGQEVIMPNRKLFEENVTNYVTHGKRRVDLAVGVSYADNLEEVEKIAIKAVEEVEGVKDVTLFYEEFGGSSINFSIMAWIEYPEQPSFLKTRSLMIKSIKKAFDRNDITIPFPIRTLDFDIKGGETLGHVLSNNMSLAENNNHN